LDKSARILIVDDDESIRSTMKAILVDAGYTVDIAVNGAEAVEKTEKTPYNIALIDIRLPDIEGIELLTKIKDNVPKTRKIMVTGFPTMQNAITALNNDADAYIVKPVDIVKLLMTIKEQLELQEQERRYSEDKIADFIETRVKELTVRQP
jgi:DNA-binding NtrC family response regulator